MRSHEAVRTLVAALGHGLGENLAKYNRRWETDYTSLSEVAFDLINPTVAYSHSPMMKAMLSTPEVVDSMRLALFWLSRD